MVRVRVRVRVRARARARVKGKRYPNPNPNPNQQLTPREYLPRSKTPIYGTSDGRHLWPYLNVALLNQVLNLLQQTVEEGAVCAQ